MFFVKERLLKRLALPVALVAVLSIGAGAVNTQSVDHADAPDGMTDDASSVGIIHEGIIANPSGSQSDYFEITRTNGFRWYAENNGTSSVAMTLTDPTGWKFFSYTLDPGEKWQSTYDAPLTGQYHVRVLNRDGSRLNFPFRVNEFT